MGNFIRGMQEARDALAEILALPERRQQIIGVMMKIMLCMTKDTRRFLADGMAGLIEGGLDYMRQKRREAIEAMQREAQQKAGEEKLRLEAQKRDAERHAAAAAAPQKKATGDLRDMDTDVLAKKIREGMLKRREEERKKRIKAGLEQEEVVAPPPPPPEPAFEPIEIEKAPEPEEPVVLIPSEEPVVEAPPPPPPPPPPEPEPVPEPQPEPEPIVLIDAEEMKQIEELGTELDALSLADVAREVFPDLKNEFAPWQVARAIYMDEAAARKAILQGARLKDKERATMLAPALDDMKRLIHTRKPFWMHSIPSLKECIDAQFAAEPPVEGGPTAEQVFNVIAMADAKAMEMLKSIVKSNEPGVAFAADIRRKLEKLIDIDAKMG
jgi:hypothetical protein